MRKALTAAMAAITLGGAVMATAAPAEAQHYRGGGYYGGGHYGGGRYYGHSNNGGAALAAGVVGLALGAAIASNHNGYYDRGYYGRPAYAYDDGPGYYEPYRTCVTTRWVWDPYIGRRVPVESRYAC